MYEKIWGTRFVFFILGVLLIVLGRLPQLSSPHLDLDGDEAIVGLMAKHQLEGKTLPLFFYGQKYGFSLVETSIAALFFRIAGISTIALKASMLFLWILGWIFFVLALESFSNQKNAFVFGAILIFCPAWSLWSMMARGGYLTAFFLFSLCLWGLGQAYKKNIMEKYMGVFLGFCLALLCLSQPLFFLAYLPLALFIGLRFSFPYLSCILSFVMFSSFFIFLNQESTFWSPQLFSWKEPLSSIFHLPDRLWAFSSGIYYLEENEAFRGFFTILSANLWNFFIFCIPLTVLFYFFKRKGSWLFYVSFFSVSCVIVASLFFVPFGCRYLLPLPSVMIFFFSQALFLWKEKMPPLIKHIFWGGFLLILLSGTGSLWEARRYSKSWDMTWDSHYAEAKKELIQSLLEHQIHHVYCLHPLFQWNILWDSQEKIIARYIYLQDRYPLYPQSVDRAFFSAKNVAIVGRDFQIETLILLAQKIGIPSLPARVLPGGYFWISPIDIRLLRHLGFELWEKK